MEKQRVYTHQNGGDVGAFREDALSESDAASATDDGSLASQTDAMMADMLDSMRRQSVDANRRREVGSRLV